MKYGRYPEKLVMTIRGYRPLIAPGKKQKRKNSKYYWRETSLLTLTAII